MSTSQEELGTKEKLMWKALLNQEDLSPFLKSIREEVQLIFRQFNISFSSVLYVFNYPNKFSISDFPIIFANLIVGF